MIFHTESRSGTNATLMSKSWLLCRRSRRGAGCLRGGLPSPPLTTGQVDLLKADSVASGDLPGFPELNILPRAVEDVVTDLYRPVG
jgi:hypothetical protein